MSIPDPVYMKKVVKKVEYLVLNFVIILLLGSPILSKEFLKTKIGTINVKNFISQDKEIGMVEISPDHKNVIFDINDHKLDQGNLYISQLDRSDPVNLTMEGSQKHIGWAKFTPDGLKIVYVNHGLTVGYGLAQIWIMDIDGKTKKYLTPNDGVISTNIEISPQGDKIIFNAFYRRDKTNFLEVINIDGTNSVKIFKEAQRARWSPDGQKILFKYFDGKEMRCYIAVINSDGTNFKQIAFFDPANKPKYLFWSRNGKRIIYSDDKFIYSIDQKGLGKKEIKGIIFGVFQRV